MSGNRTFRKFRVVAVIGIPILLLAACQTPEPGVRVETVEVPVTSPCLPPDQIPEEPAPVADRFTGDKAKDFDILVPSAIALRTTVKELRAALIACAE